MKQGLDPACPTRSCFNKSCSSAFPSSSSSHIQSSVLYHSQALSIHRIDIQIDHLHLLAGHWRNRIATTNPGTKDASRVTTIIPSSSYFTFAPVPTCRDIFASSLPFQLHSRDQTSDHTQRTKLSHLQSQSHPHNGHASSTATPTAHLYLSATKHQPRDPVPEPRDTRCAHFRARDRC